MTSAVTRGNEPDCTNGSNPEPSPIEYDRKHHYTADKAINYDASRSGPLSSPLARRRWKAELDAISSIAKSIPANSTILDLPCGTGRFFPILQAAGHRVIGGDVSGDMLRAIPNSHRSLSNVFSVRCEAERIPVAAESVDVVLSMRFWSFLPNDVRRFVLAEWRRIARRGIFLQVRLRSDERKSPPMETDSECKATHGSDSEIVDSQQRANWPTNQEFMSMIESAGFRVTDSMPLDWGTTNDPVRIYNLQNE